MTQNKNSDDFSTREARQFNIFWAEEQNKGINATLFSARKNEEIGWFSLSPTQWAARMLFKRISMKDVEQFLLTVIDLSYLDDIPLALLDTGGIIDLTSFHSFIRIKSLLPTRRTILILSNNEILRRKIVEGSDTSVAVVCHETVDRDFKNWDQKYTEKILLEARRERANFLLDSKKRQ